MHCLRCGACCTYLIVEVEPLDVAREPRIADALGKPRITAEDAEKAQRVEDYGRCYVLAPRLGPGRELLPCPLLSSAPSATSAVGSPPTSCTIHATKPDDCAGFPPGGRQCRMARRMAREKRPAKFVA